MNSPSNRHFGLAPSPWVVRFAPLVAPGRRVLDLAAGHGRHALFFAARGVKVLAVDRDAAALATLEGRKSAEDRIDARVSAWTCDRDAGEIEQALAQLGIPAHALLDTHELLHDAQLQFRGHVHRIPHPQFGMTAIEGSRVLMSQSAAAQPTLAVSYGSHNAQVLGDILGYKEPRIAQLAARGALQ